MLFKVEVNDANLYRNWRSFTVKKLTLDDEIIKGFLTFHGINVSKIYPNLLAIIILHCQLQISSICIIGCD